MPSRSAETFGLAAAEAMAAGLPVAASAAGRPAGAASRGGEPVAAPGDAGALAAGDRRGSAGDRAAGDAGASASRELCAPERVRAALAGVYERPAALDAGALSDISCRLCPTRSDAL